MPSASCFQKPSPLLLLCAFRMQELRQLPDEERRYRRRDWQDRKHHLAREEHREPAADEWPCDNGNAEGRIVVAVDLLEHGSIICEIARIGRACRHAEAPGNPFEHIHDHKQHHAHREGDTDDAGDAQESKEEKHRHPRPDTVDNDACCGPCSHKRDIEEDDKQGGLHRIST